MRYASGQTDTLIATVQFTPVSEAKYIKLSAASSEIILLHFSGEDFVKNCPVGLPYYIQQRNSVRIFNPQQNAGGLAVLKPPGSPWPLPYATIPLTIIIVRLIRHGNVLQPRSTEF